MILRFIIIMNPYKVSDIITYAVYGLYQEKCTNKS